MFKTLKRNYVATDFSATNWDEINLLTIVADNCAAELALDNQVLRSSFLSSEVNGACIVDQHIAIARASYPELDQPKFRLFPLEPSVAWGDDEIAVDYILAVILPNGHDATELDRITAAVQQQFAEKPVTVSETRKLEKMMSKLIKTLA